MISVVIVCGGTSSRFGKEVNKVLLPLGDKPIFMHSVEKFSKFSDDVIVVANINDVKEIKQYHCNVVLGGKSRQESVFNGVIKARHNRILIHDGARPFVSEEEILSLINSEAKCAFIGIKPVNTLKMIDGYRNINRDNFVEALTPQLVEKNLYIEAYQKTNDLFTDDVSLIQSVLDIPVSMVLGSKNNYKITTYDDYERAVKILTIPRIGHSWDCHQLVEGRKLILGGVEIPFEKGLLGHSDADALLHAISESLLGALALGDLGTHFSDKDERYRGMDSKLILAACYEMIKNQGYQVSNLDTMIYAEAPKMAKYIPLMRQVIAKILEIDESQVSIKATTYEKMDAIGAGLAIACEAHCIVVKKTA